MAQHIKKAAVITSFIMAVLSFFIALLAGLGSQTLVNALNSVSVAIILLLIIILLGIFFDIIGTAVTAAELPPFNAKAAKKEFGAKQAVKITHNASIVANWCNDVVGDIAGTLSGAIGAGIVVSLMQAFSFLDVVYTGAIMTSLIAALTIGGKSLGKSMAVRNANKIILQVGKILAWWENITGMELLNNRR